MIFTKLSKNYTNTLAFKIEKINVPEENVILKNSDSVVNVTLKTHGFKWLNYYLNKPKITIDFSKDVEVSNSVFTCDKPVITFITNRSISNQVELINISPSSLKFNFDVNLVKKVPVILKTDIAFTQGFDISDEFKLEPDSIKVIGPHSLASQFKYIETELVSLNDVKSDIQSVVKLILPDEGIKLSNETVALNAVVEKFTEGVVKVPITILNIPEGLLLKYFPKEVNVTFYTSLSNFNKVKAKDFKVVCDYSKLAEKQSFLLPEIRNKSEFAKTVKLNQQHIEFIILE
ncbi:CdaR family protein [uncultured Algibacter sp.]|uniref:CdaR family protein n=1 Tax=uncultured Algibacter sp. TaxID=298659 RepID=UPI0026139A0C|nr:CdaR family protein [uncultured Algibacter sp.]